MNAKRKAFVSLSGAPESTNATAIAGSVGFELNCMFNPSVYRHAVGVLV
jgi:hypothetical protein